MRSAAQEFEAAVRMAVWVIYGVGGFIWLVSLALAGYRIYQMRTLTAVDAEVVRTGLDSYRDTQLTREPDGFTREYGTTVYVPSVVVRYEFNGQAYTAEARYDSGSSFRSVEQAIANRWKPGARIRVHINPARPDKPVPEVRFNLPAFRMSIVSAVFGFCTILLGYGFGRLGAFGVRFFEQLKHAPTP